MLNELLVPDSVPLVRVAVIALPVPAPETATLPVQVPLLKLAVVVGLIVVVAEHRCRLFP